MLQTTTAPARRPAGVSQGRPSKSRAHRQRAAYLFIAPAVLVTGLFLLYPFAWSIGISFTDWNFLSSPAWIGLGNYVDLLTDPVFFNSLMVTIYYVGGTTLVTIPLAFLLAVALRAVGPIRRLFTPIFFLPVMLSTVIASVLFVSVFNPYGGVLRLLPLPFGLSDVNWYQSPELVIPALIIFSLWKGLGLYIVIFGGALENLPEEPFEAARLDGASKFQLMRYLTLPMMRPMFLFAAVVSMIFGFQNFAIVYTSTKGGPAAASEILPILVYERAFRDFDMGSASAIAVVTFALVALLTVVQFRVLGGRRD